MSGQRRRQRRALAPSDRRRPIGDGFDEFFIDFDDPNPSAFMRKFDAPFTAADFEETEDIPLPPDGRSRFVPGLV